MKMLLSRVSEAYHASLQQAFPDHEFVHIENPQAALSLASEADAAFGLLSRDFINAATKIQWIQSPSSGANTLPLDLMKARGIVLTNAAGNYGPNMADHTLAMMLMLARQIEKVRRAVLADGWGCERPIPDPGELARQTLLVVGLGGIGLETARRAAGFGMRILATRRHTDRGKPDFVEAIYPPEALHELLPEADWIAVCVPFTPETKGLIQDREFDLMKPGVHLLCVTRGGIINTEALMRALDSGKVAGAGLDVTDPEPLPLDHPLWSYENVIITPHASGRAEAAFRRLEDLLRDNIRRFLNGDPLRNVVDFDLQY